MSDQHDPEVTPEQTAAAEPSHDGETQLESVSEEDAEVELILAQDGVERDDSPPMLRLHAGEVTQCPIRIYLANASEKTAHWSITYGSVHVHGDQEARSFNVMSLPYQPVYTVCYWVDPTTRSCAEVDASDCVVFNGEKAIRTAG